MARHGDDRGQASVELAGLLPLIAALVVLLWQAVVAGQAVWLAGTAARAAARAEAVGGDPAAAARATLPPALRRGLRAEPEPDGGVRLRLRVPTVVGDHRLVSVTARARFRPQEG
ncbi:hypothetical protein NBH00_07065 [Paraconexibacter antarcticus]|uniref:TadE-like protein n=1 Tax=Paraconexibacter antarcticus TaxID=2949664 RepID=A0ABY5DYQ1_9ACTN|nr:hypothetical protein [Paraconexibacter antarcticus]UTI65962.1 hypothetical protein NBH00_07065 [Paraconexibacter antarcticus]